MINFECNGCGNCCIKTTPSLTINEFLRLYQEMPSVVLFAFSLATGKKKTKGFEVTNKHGTKYRVIGQVISIPNKNGCNNLDKDYLCKIYKKRPTVCALYPISPGISIEGVKKGLETEKSRKQNDTCEGFKENSPVIFMNNALVNLNTVKLINERFEDNNKSDILLEAMFEKLMDFDYVSNEINNNKEGECLICTEDLLLFLKEKEIINNDEFKEIVKIQKLLFNKINLSFNDYIMETDSFFDGIKSIIDYNLEQFE